MNNERTRLYGCPQTPRYYYELMRSRRPQQVCVEFPLSAVNVTLLAFVAERRRLQHGAHSAPAAIDRYLLPARRSAANPRPPLLLSIDGTDKRTDGQNGRMPDRYLDTASPIMRGSVNKRPHYEWHFAACRNL